MKIKFEHKGEVPLDQYPVGTLIIVLHDWGEGHRWYELCEVATWNDEKVLIRFNEYGEKLIVDNEEFDGWGALEIEEMNNSEPKVYLTIKEAKNLLKALDCLEADVEGIDETSQSLIKSRCARYHLEERIKQVEIKE